MTETHHLGRSPIHGRFPAVARSGAGPRAPDFRVAYKLSVAKLCLHNFMTEA